MKLALISLILAVALVGFGCRNSSTTQTADTAIDRGLILLEARLNGLIMHDEEIAAMAKATLELDEDARTPQDVEAYLETNLKDWWSAALADVTGGEGYGLAHATLKDGTFTLLAEMGNLSEPASGHFYEAWLVRRAGEIAVLSLGPIQKTEKGFAIIYLTSTDFSDHDFFVLTLESDDGNPAPSEHILEGILK